MDFAGNTWFYDFRQLPQQVADDAARSVIASLQERYASLTKEWNDASNTEWLCRHYVAAKMIMVATLKINAMEYAESKNLRVVIPYLQYYALLSLMRALVLTLPERPWQSGRLMEISHDSAINSCASHIASFNKQYAATFKEFALLLKSSRELLSYRAPSSGDENLPKTANFIGICTSIAEFAQLNSELLARSLKKRAFVQKFTLDQNELYPLVNSEMNGHSFWDREDAYRLSYYARRQAMPTNIMFMMREGHVEDFFGAWLDKHENEDAFDPDRDWGIIFDIP